MSTLALIGLGIAALGWGYLLAFHGGFWRADQRLADVPPPDDWPEVVAVIPARNEAETIADVVASHGASTYPGRFSVIVVDDGSSDGTGEVARAAASVVPRAVEVIEAPPLAPGWSGKLNALAAGVEAARKLAPGATYVMLADADIVHRRGTLSRLVAMAEIEALAMVSLMARLDSRGVWGALLIPAFVFFFQKLYPFPSVNLRGHPTAAAAGGCVLIRRDALDGIGGIAAIKGALIDDCTLAARVKRGPPARAIWLGLADREVISLRDNRALGSIWAMVARTAYTQLRHSPLLLAGSVVGMAVLYLAGPLAALSWPLHGSGLAAGLGALAWAMMAVAYWPTLRLYGFWAPWALSLPVAAGFYMAMTLSSARRHWRGQGGTWKGRTYGAGG